MSAPHVPDLPAWVNADRETESIFRQAEQDIALYRLQCAAITNGCTSFLAFEGERNIDVDHLDPLVWADRRAARLLALNGWHVDHGRWVCGAHPASSSAPSSPAAVLADEMAPEGR